MLLLSAKRDFACYSLDKVQPAIRAVWLFALWPHYTPTAGNVNSSIAQKSAADFMQIDETDIIYIIVYNSWTTIKVYEAAQRLSEPF